MCSTTVPLEQSGICSLPSIMEMKDRLPQWPNQFAPQLIVEPIHLSCTSMEPFPGFGETENDGKPGGKVRVL